MGWGMFHVKLNTLWMLREHAVHVTLPVWGGGWGGVGHVSCEVEHAVDVT